MKRSIAIAAAVLALALGGCRANNSASHTGNPAPVATQEPSIAPQIAKQKVDVNLSDVDTMLKELDKQMAEADKTPDADE